MLEERIEEVNKANHAFYAAFGNLDIGEMDEDLGAPGLCDLHPSRLDVAVGLAARARLLDLDLQ